VLRAPADGAKFECPHEHACVWRTSQAVALTAELIDPREQR